MTLRKVHLRNMVNGNYYGFQIWYADCANTAGGTDYGWVAVDAVGRIYPIDTDIKFYARSDLEAWVSGGNAEAIQQTELLAQQAHDLALMAQMAQSETAIYASPGSQQVLIDATNEKIDAFNEALKSQPVITSEPSRLGMPTYMKPAVEPPVQQPELKAVSVNPQAGEPRKQNEITIQVIIGVIVAVIVGIIMWLMPHRESD